MDRARESRRRRVDNIDLIAFATSQIEEVGNYIKKYYGDVPRIRGVRFMKLESKTENKPNIDVTDLFPTDEIDEVIYNSDINSVFNKYTGQDVIYIHTRCGDCGKGYDDEESNYVYCGAKKWEEEHKDLFLEHVTDPFDSTYCTHYFKAVIDEDYKKFISDR